MATTDTIYVVSTDTSDSAWRVEGETVLYASPSYHHGDKDVIRHSNYDRSAFFRANFNFKESATADHPLIKRYWPEDSE